MAPLFRARTYEVVVAAFGDISKPFGEGVPWPEEWEKPYRDRPKVSRRIRGSDTLGAVLLDAMAELQVQPPPWDDPFPLGLPFVAFYKPEDEERFSSGFQSTVPLLDAQGRVTFGNYNFGEITFDELIQAADAKALDGDPLRPWLILHYEVGNGLASTWGTLVNLWDLSWYVLAYVDSHLETLLGVSGGVYAVKRGVIDRLRGRTRAARDAAARHGQRWHELQAADPQTVASFLEQVPRTTEQVAGLLGCTAAEAEAVLWAFGLAPEPETGLWKPSTDEESKMLRGNAELIISGFNTEELERLFRERAEHLVVEGETPPLEWPHDAQQGSDAD